MWMEVIVRSLIAIAAILGATRVLAAPPHLSEGVLVDEHGMTLYAYAGKGTPDAAACEGACELNFPPAIADKRDTPDGSLTLVSTQTGERQWAYRGHRLYHGRMDKKPGDRHADGLNKVWYPVGP
jgi:predicted lipoprotein with Yx(FWY)xxD motif